ncbi:hypothetical protein HYC85_015784, partial [Camellia sinensis]
ASSPIIFRKHRKKRIFEFRAQIIHISYRLIPPENSSKLDLSRETVWFLILCLGSQGTYYTIDIEVIASFDTQNMKYLEYTPLDRINDFLSHVNLGERTIKGCLEAYSCKHTGTDKKLSLSLEHETGENRERGDRSETIAIRSEREGDDRDREQEREGERERALCEGKGERELVEVEGAGSSIEVEWGSGLSIEVEGLWIVADQILDYLGKSSDNDSPSPVEYLCSRSSRKTLIYLILTLYQMYPDYDFSFMGGMATHYNSLNGIGSVVKSAVKAHQFFMEENWDSFKQIFDAYMFEASKEWVEANEGSPLLDTLYKALDEVVKLAECEIYSYDPESDADPFLERGAINLVADGFVTEGLCNEEDGEIFDDMDL